MAAHVCVLGPDPSRGVSSVPSCFVRAWQNFFPGSMMEVLIGTQKCTNIVMTNNATLGEFTCVAPAGPGFGAVQLRVTVPGSGTGAIRFLYDAPSVTRVVGSPCDASTACPVQVRGTLCGRPRCPELPGVGSAGRVNVCNAAVPRPQIVGVNLGSRSPLTGAEPAVFVGEWQEVPNRPQGPQGPRCEIEQRSSCIAMCALLSTGMWRVLLPVAGAETCTEPVVVNSSHLLCTAPRMRVGAYPISVTLNDQNSTASAVLHRLCDEGWFGLPGQECDTCPEVRCRPCVRAPAWHRPSLSACTTPLISTRSLCCMNCVV